MLPFGYLPLGLFVSRSTPAERAVLLVTFIGICCIAGTVGLYFGYTAPADKADAAAELRQLSWLILGLGAITWIIYRAVSWALERLL